MTLLERLLWAGLGGGVALLLAGLFAPAPRSCSVLCVYSNPDPRPSRN